MQIYLMKNIIVTFFFQHVSLVVSKANLKPHKNNQSLRFFAGIYLETRKITNFHNAKKYF